MLYGNITSDVGAAINAQKLLWNYPVSFRKVVINLVDLRFMKENLSKRNLHCYVILKQTYLYQVHSFFVGLVYFLLSLISMLRKKPFSVSKCAKDMFAYRKQTPQGFMQHTTALHERGSKCCSMEIIIVLTCQKHMKRFETCCIFSQKYFCQLNIVHSFFFSLSLSLSLSLLPN